MSKLFIICGHGAGDSGATGNGYTEAERVRTLAKRIKEFGGANVTIGDMNRNWYKENLVNNNNIPKGSIVIELHMDSSPGAKGAHVIIDGNLNPDKYDEALAKFISGVFPGRASIIVKRNDLANPNRAQRDGINYRLLECGFISNAGDVNIFNSRMDDIAKGILKCFDIGVTTTESSAESYIENSTANKNVVYRVQVNVPSNKSVYTLAKELEAKHFGTYIVDVDGQVKIQTGAFRDKTAADKQVAKLKQFGFDASTTTKVGKPANGSVVSVQFKVGDVVKLQEGAPVYNTTRQFASWVYNSKLFVRSVYNDRVVISTLKQGPVTGAVDKKYLTKV